MIGAAKVARRYAKALLDIGREEGKYLEYGRELGKFVKLCEATPELLGVLSSKIIPSQDRMRILNTILEKTHFSEVTKKFLQVLLDKERIGFLKDVNSYYTKLCDELEGIVRARVKTAFPLKKKSVERLNEVLNQFTGKKVIMEVSEAPELIGGVVVQIGDFVIDGSIKTQLEGLKESLKRGGYK